MDTPVGSPARARVASTAPRLEDALLDEFDDDDESNVDYAPLGNLDSDVDFSADSGDEEDEEDADGDGDVTRDTVDREDISDSDTDVSLEEEISARWRRRRCERRRGRGGSRAGNRRRARV